MHKTGKHGTAVTVLVCSVFSETQPGRDCPMLSRENTGQTGRDNVLYFQTDGRDGTIKSSVF